MSIVDINPRVMGRSLQERRAIADMVNSRDNDRALRRAIGVRGYDFLSGVVSTSSGSRVSLGGPTVKMRVPEFAGGGGVAYIPFVFEAEVRAFSGGVNTALFYMYEATDYPTGILVDTHKSVVANTYELTVVNAMLRLTPGLRTIELQYASYTGNNVDFRNRRLALRNF